MIIVFVTHADDEVLGCGGMIAEYSRRGEKILPVIISSGEKSNILEDNKIIIAKRKKESQRASKILGAEDPIFIGIKDELTGRSIRKTANGDVEKIIRKNKPRIIFTHCLDDPHPAHRAISEVVRSAIKKTKYKPNIYAFHIGGLYRLRHRESPELYIDVSKVYNKKKRAMKSFKSQYPWILYYISLAIIRDKLSGMHINSNYAEKFYRVSI